MALALRHKAEMGVSDFIRIRPSTKHSQSGMKIN
jgi:hypothetical protein